MASGLIFNTQRFSIQDGPGIRTTVFLKGCPLRCWWCHNPEGLSPEPEIVLSEGRCLSCGECERVCPLSGFSAEGDPSSSGNHICLLCGNCVTACPTGARQMIGKWMSVSEVLEETLQDRLFYDQSGGGVTFSGGEPLMQPVFLEDLLRACREQGLHTAVDTCGYGTQEQLLSIAALTDLFLYDLKFIDEDKHREYTGVSNALILDNLKALGNRHNNIWLRVPVIPGLNDDDEHLIGVARLAESISGVRQVSLLPYHRTGVAKFRRLGKTYRLAQTPDPTPAQLETLKERFSTFGLKARIGG